ncbi:MAG: hypothetical protein ACO3SV_04680 [Burkholderiaceae bacterium]
MLGPLGRGLVIGAGLLVVSFYVYPDYPLLSLALVLLAMVVGFWLRKPLLQEQFLKRGIPHYLQEIVAADESLHQKLILAAGRSFTTTLDRFELKFSYASGLSEKTFLEDTSLSLMMLDVIDRRTGFNLCSFQPSPNPVEKDGDFHPKTFGDDSVLAILEAELVAHLSLLQSQNPH